MALKEKIILIWLTYFFTFLGVSKIFTIIPFLLEVKIQNRFVGNFIEFVFKPVELICTALGYAAMLMGPLFFLMAFLLVLVRFLLYAAEGFLLAKVVLFLARSEKVKDVLGDLSVRAAIKLGAKDKITAYGEQKNIKYLAIALIFIFLLIFSYPTIKEKFAKKPVVSTKKETIIEQAQKIEASIDSDNDGLPDKAEFILGTNPYFADTDNDGHTDYDELKNGYNPFIASSGDKLSSDTYELVKKQLFVGKDINFNELENLRLALIGQISGKLCEKSPYAGENNQEDMENLAKRAIQTKDSCFCSKISDDQYRNACFNKVALSSANMSLCNYIFEEANAQGYREDCLHTSMLITLDWKYCDRIRGAKKQGDCFMVLGLKTKNYAVCDKAVSQNGKDDCYWSIAIFTKNESLCEKISLENTSGNSRESCHTMIKSPLPKIGF